MPEIHILSGGAAQGLVNSLQARFEKETGCTVRATFGAVGAMKDRMLQQEPCDVLILTQKLITELAQQGRVRAETVEPVGTVHTGVAVKQGAPRPDVANASALRGALLNANSIYFPDPHRATAGIHFMNVLKQLGIVDEVAERLRPHPNGATAMRHLSLDPEPGAIGCTQASEILFADGVELVALLPDEYGLSTVYTAGVPDTAREQQLAKALIGYLMRPEHADLRRSVGMN